VTASRDARPLPAWLPAVGIGIALAALVGWSFAQRWRVLSGSPFPIGIDGYFYPVELRSLLDHGSLQYPASPLAFWLLAPFAALTDPITGAKLGAALLGALIAVPAYGVGVHLGRDRGDRGRGPGLVAAAVATSSAGSMYLTIEFVKNGIGLTVALTALWLVLRALDRPTRWRIAGAIGAIAAAVLTHKMAAALVVGIALPATLVEARARGVLRGRRMILVVAVVAAAVVALLAIGLAAPRRFVSPADLRLLDGLFTTDADWSMPVLADRLRLQYEPAIGAVVAVSAAIILFFDHGATRGRALALGGTLVATIGTITVLGAALIGRSSSGGVADLVGVGGLIGVLVGGLSWRLAERMPAATATVRAADGSAGTRIVAWCAIGLGVVIGLPWLDATDTQGLAMRLRVIAFVPLALSAAVVLRIVVREALPLFAGDRKPSRTAICAVIAAGVVALHVGGGPRTEGQILTHPALVTSAQALTGRLPPDAVAIVPERHIAFMVAWYARVPVAIRPEGIAEDRRWRVLPLAYIARGEHLDGALVDIRSRTDLPRPLGLHPHHVNGMVAVPEVTWRAVLARLPAGERALFEAWPTI